MRTEWTAISNNLGFTLIEVLISIIIMMVGLLGLLQTINVALNHNIQNQLRNEAVMVADQVLARKISELSTSSSQADFQSFENYTNSRRSINNGFRNYSIKIQGVVVPVHSLRVNVNVNWKHKDVRYEHGAMTIITKK